MKTLLLVAGGVALYLAFLQPKKSGCGCMR